MSIVLKAGGNRTTVLLAAEAKSIVARFENELARYDDQIPHLVDLSCRSWTQEAIEVFVAFIEQHATSVKILKIDDCIAGRMTDEGLAVMNRLAEAFAGADLKEVELSDNAMGPRGLLRVKPLFEKSHMQRLYLSNCGLSAESMEMLHEAVLADDGRIANCLTDLVLDKNMIGVVGAKLVGKFLSRCKKLEYLSYVGCRPEPEGTKYVCEGVKGLTEGNASNLRHLDLDDCTIGSSDDDAIAPLCDALATCRQLKYLSMRGGDLELDGLQRLVNSLLTSQAKLDALILESNGEFASEGAKVLADFLYTQTTSIRCLNVDSNELGDDGVCILMAPLASARNCLEELSLNQNEIEKKGAEALVRAHLPKLKKLSLDDNMDMPKKYVRLKYGNVAFFGEDDDEEEEEMDEGMDDLIKQFTGLGK